MGSGATKPVYEPVEFTSDEIFAQNQGNTRVVFKQHTNDVKEISCFSSSKISMRNNSELIKISVRGAGVLRIGVTEQDPKIQTHFPEEPLFEQEDGFEPGTAERVLYYHDNSFMFCYGPPDDHMEFSPNGTKSSTHVFIYVMFLYGKPTVSLTYDDSVVDMTTYTTSNLRKAEDSSITVTSVKNASIMKLKEKTEFGNVYHIQWNMELSKEIFAEKTPKFGYLRIGLIHGDINEKDEQTTWCRESAVTQYPYSGTIALEVNRNKISHNLLLSSVETTKIETLPEHMSEMPSYLFIEAASGEFTIQRSPKFTVKQGLGSTYFVRDHDELSANPKFMIQNKVGHEPYHIQYGLNPRAFIIMFNKYFTNSDEVAFKKTFVSSIKIGMFDTIQVLYKEGELSHHTIEEAFRRKQQTGGGEIQRNGIQKGENVSRCWIIQYKNVEDARRVWLRRELDIDGVKVHILPWYRELGEAVNYGNKPVFDDTDLVISDIDQDRLKFVLENKSMCTDLERTINKQVPAFLILQQDDEFKQGSNDNIFIIIRIDVEKCRDHKTRVFWKDMVKGIVESYFDKSVLTEEIKLDKKGYETAIKRLDELKENLKRIGGNFVIKRNRRENTIKVIASTDDLLDTIIAKIHSEKHQPNKTSLTIQEDELDRYRYHALEDEGLLDAVRAECSNTRFKVTDTGEIELQGPEAEVKNAKESICSLAIHMSQLHEPLTEGKVKFLQDDKFAKNLQRALKNEKLSYHFRIEKMICKLWICTNKDEDFEEKSKLFKKCINSVVHEISLSISQTPSHIHIVGCIETMQKETLHIQLDEKGKKLVISGTESDVKEAEKSLKFVLAETPETATSFILSPDVLEYIETWCEKFCTDPFNLEYDDRNQDFGGPVKIVIKSTEASLKKLEDELLQEARDIKSYWFRLSKPWLAVHREEIKDIVKWVIRKHPATIDIETVPSLIHKNISGVALHTSVGTMCLPICCDITQCRVDAIVVPVDSDNLKQAKSPVTNKVITLGGKAIEDEYKSKGKLVSEKPLLLQPGNLPCQSIILVYLPTGKDITHVEALKSGLKIVQDSFYTSIMIPIKAFCNESKLDQSIDEIVQAIYAYVAKNPKGSLKEIGICDTKADLVEKVENSMKKNLKKPWFDFWHGNKVQEVKEDGVSNIGRPLSSKDQRMKNSIFWGTATYGPKTDSETGNVSSQIYRFPYVPSLLRLNKEAAKDESDTDDEEITLEDQKTVKADFGNGLPYKLELTDKLEVQIIRGKIEEMDTEVIVNPSPLFPEKAGAIFNALVRKGGSSIIEECKQHGKIHPGEVKETNAGNLKCKKLYHTLQPTDWKPETGFGSVHEIVKQSLELAHKNQMSSIAFPAIGTGQSRFPADKVAEAMVKAIFDFTDKCDPSAMRKIIIVIFFTDDPTVKVFENTVPLLIRNPTDELKKQKKGKVEDGPLRQKDKRTEIAQKQMKKLVFLPTRKPAIHTESDDLMFIKLTMKGDLKAAVQDFENLVNRTFIRKIVEYGKKKKDGQENPNYLDGPNLTSQEVDLIKNLERAHSIAVQVEADKRTIVIEGLSGYVKNAEFALSNLLILTIPTERRSQKMKKEVMENVQWFYDDNGHLTPYDEVSNFAIHFGYLDLKDFEYHNNKEDKRYKVLQQTLEEHPVNDSTQKRKMVQRQKVREGIQIPQTWTIKETMSEQALVELDSTANEYDEVKKKLIKDGCPCTQILKIARVEDRYKYLQYESKMKQLEKQNPRGTKNEKRLWHGTDSDTYLKILQNGFDRSFAGKNAIAYGEGVYFAAASSYSHRYAVADHQGTHRIFLNKVLVGEYCTGRGGMFVLPQKTTVGNMKILYDSAVDNTKNPAIFVIFHDTQAYPEYLIEYN